MASVRSSLRRSNPARKRKLYKEQFGGPEYPIVDYSEGIRRMPCCVCWPDGVPKGTVVMASSMPHHAKTRGAGGKWFHLVPLCISHHQEVHQVGFDRFDAKYSVDLKALALELSTTWREKIA